MYPFKIVRARKRAVAELMLDKLILKEAADARDDIFDYIEFFYNLKRKHSNNGMLSPIDFEQQIILKKQTV